MFKLLHVLGAVLFVGNLLVGAWWHWRAVRSADPRQAAQLFALLGAGDLRFTATGALLLLVGGGGLLSGAADALVTQAWLTGGISLFVFSAGLWAVVLVPLRRQLWRQLGRAPAGGTWPEGSGRLARGALLLAWLVAAMALGGLVLMVLRP
ncbi:MAG TPA: DUF2269 family protein [Gammaproteobacteria bacterium]